MRKFLASQLQARPRMFIALAIGAITGFVATGMSDIVTRILLGWNVGVWLYLLLTAHSMLQADHQRLRRAALAHAEGAATVLAVVVAAATASLVAIVFELALNKAAGAPHEWPQIALTLATITGSWLLVPSLFTLNYASLYYANDQRLGLVFPGQGEDYRPDYWDFLYFSFTIAVASQTADVVITTQAMRRLVLAHSVLSFAFNTTILAFMVNIAASLF